MQFKKADSNELQRSMTIVICIIMALIPISAFIQKWFIIPLDESGYVNFAEMLLTVGCSILCVFIVMFLRLKENRYLGVIDILVLAVFASLTISTLFAQNINLALYGNDFSSEGFIVLCCYLVLLFAASLITEYKYRIAILCSVALMGLFEVFMGFMQTIMDNDFFWGTMKEIVVTQRAYGSVYNQNAYGALMSMLAGVSFGMLFVSEKMIHKLIYGLLSALFVFATVISGTRGAMLGLFVASMIAAVFVVVSSHQQEKGILRPIKKIAIVLGFCIFCLVLVFVFKRELIYEIIGRVSNDVSNAKSGNSEMLGSSRVGIWMYGLEKFFYPHPIIGSGVSNFFMFRIGVNEQELQKVFFAHNHYIELLCDQGIVGLVTYLGLVGYIIIKAFSIIRKKGVFYDGITLGCVIATLAFAVIDITGWHIIFITPYFFLFLGMACPRKETRIK